MCRQQGDAFQNVLLNSSNLQTWFGFYSDSNIVMLGDEAQHSFFFVLCFTEYIEGFFNIYKTMLSVFCAFSNVPKEMIEIL